MLEILSSSYIFKNLFTNNFCLPVLASRTLREDTEELLKYFVIFSLMHIVCVCVCVCVCAQARTRAQSLSHIWVFVIPWSLPGSFVHGIFQARVLEQVAVSYSRGSSSPRNQTCVSCASWIVRQILYHLATWEAPVHIMQVIKWLACLTQLSLSSKQRFLSMYF